MSKRWLLPLVLVLLGGALGAGSTWTQLAQAPQGRTISDFQILYVSGKALTAGMDIHDTAVMDAMGRSVGRPATPFCAYNPLVVRAFGLFEGVPFGEAFGILNLNYRYIGTGI